MLKKIEDISDIDDLVGINELDLNTELATCAAYFYNVSCAAVEAKSIYEQCILELETYEVELSEKFRVQIETTKGKTALSKITQTEIKRQFRDDPHWIALKHQELKSQKQYEIMEKATKALEMKSRMLSSLNRRQLVNSGMGIGSHID